MVDQHDESQDSSKPESPKGYDAYIAKGGKLTADEYQKVWDTPSSVKHRHLAVEAGIHEQMRQLLATSVIGAFGRNDERVQSTLWLRTEADAFYASMNSGEEPSA